MLKPKKKDWDHFCAVHRRTNKTKKKEKKFNVLSCLCVGHESEEFDRNSFFSLIKRTIGEFAHLPPSRSNGTGKKSVYACEQFSEFRQSNQSIDLVELKYFQIIQYLYY